MKKIVVMVMLLMSFGLVAQEMKIAVVNQREIFDAMPEMEKIENELAALFKYYSDMHDKMNAEYIQLNTDLINKEDSIPENLKMIKIRQLEDVASRLEKLQQSYAQDREKQQQELFAPIQEKVQKAIDQVGDENGYTYIIILEPQLVLYMGKTAIDATDKVRAKLGLK